MLELSKLWVKKGFPTREQLMLVFEGSNFWKSQDYIHDSCTRINGIEPEKTSPEFRRAILKILRREVRRGYLERVTTLQLTDTELAWSKQTTQQSADCQAITDYFRKHL
jgi:hypothetical protein